MPPAYSYLWLTPKILPLGIIKLTLASALTYSYLDKVIIGIGSNVAKQGLLSVENRKRLIDDYYAGDARVEAMIYSGMTGDFAQQVGAAAVIRGVRNTTDFEYERTMAATNRRLYPAVVTVMLFTPPDVADISSSTVREVLAFGRSVAEFLPRGIELENYL